MPKDSEKVKMASRINIKKAREVAWKLPRTPKQIEACIENGKSHKRSNGICEGCGESFERISARQKLCKICCPDRKSYFLYFAYRITKPQHDTMIATNNGMCWICLKSKATMVDHDHKTNKVRGLLCHSCNTALPIIEDRIRLERAIKYISAEVYSVRS